jgi:uncharacterized damage-inducible protein DinB
MFGWVWFMSLKIENAIDLPNLISLFLYKQNHVNNTLLHLFDSLETQRNKLLGLLAALSTEQLNNHPTGKWSIAQILSHLIASEQLSVRYLNKKILGIKEATDTGLTEELKMIALIISQRLPFLKFKAPKVMAENTPPLESFEQLNATWVKTRSDLKETLEKFQDDELKRKIYKHPFAGMLNIQQALKFFGEHIIHHRPQIIKLVRGK